MRPTHGTVRAQHLGPHDYLMILHHLESQPNQLQLRQPRLHQPRLHQPQRHQHQRHQHQRHQHQRHQHQRHQHQRHQPQLQQEKHEPATSRMGAGTRASASAQKVRDEPPGFCGGEGIASSRRTSVRRVSSSTWSRSAGVWSSSSKSRRAAALALALPNRQSTRPSRRAFGAALPVGSTSTRASPEKFASMS